MGRARRVLGRLAGVALWGVVAASIALFLLLGVVPHTGTYRTVTVLSGSMRPTFPQGAVVVVTPQRPRDLRVGQVITYQVPVGDRRIVSHRVVKIVEGAGGAHPVVETKGDANDANDAWLTKVDGDTVWRVRYAIPGLGQFMSGIRAVAHRTAAVQVVPALLAMVWLVGIWRRGPPAPAAPPKPRAVRLRQRRVARSSHSVRMAVVGVALTAVVVTRAGVAGAAGGFTTSVSATNSVSSATLQPPTGLSLSNDCHVLGQTDVRLNWTASNSPFRTGYDIRRSPTLNGTYVTVGSVTGTPPANTYLDTSTAHSTTYYYVVRTTRNSWGWLSVSTTPVQIGTPSTLCIL